MDTAGNTRKPFAASDPLGLSHVTGVKASSELLSLCPSDLGRRLRTRKRSGRRSEMCFFGCCQDRQRHTHLQLSTGTRSLRPCSALLQPGPGGPNSPVPRAGPAGCSKPQCSLEERFAPKSPCLGLCCAVREHRARPGPGGHPAAPQQWGGCGVARAERCQPGLSLRPYTHLGLGQLLLCWTTCSSHPPPPSVPVPTGPGDVLCRKV